LTWRSGPARYLLVSRRKIPKPKLPELPPGYELTWDDQTGEPECDGWQITIRGIMHDGSSPGKDRDTAVDECWSLWLTYDADPAWQAFIEAMEEM
jgi:hypothetical protein